MYILAHRGINEETGFAESSYESFKYYIEKGFGLEFDLQFTKNFEIVISHDQGFKHFSEHSDDSMFKDLTLRQITGKCYKNSHLCSFEDLFQLFELQDEHCLNALHLKAKWQKPRYLDIILNKLKNFNTERLLMFDVKPQAAKYIHDKNSKLLLAPSVSHEHDIARYNQYVGDTLISVQEAMEYKELYSWVWLDEWDRLDKNDNTKTLFNEENFSILRSCNYKIAVVSPELHFSSPNLLAEEAHQDAVNEKVLFTRIQEIINLKPDLICTDYALKIKATITK